MDKEKRFGPAYFSIFVLTGFLFLLFLLWNFDITPWDFFKFSAGILLWSYIPGHSLVELAKVRIKRLEKLALSLTLGLVTSTLIYKFTFRLGLEPVFLFWLSAHFIHVLIRMVKKPPDREAFSFRITYVGIIFAVISLLVLSVLSMDNYRNGRKQEDGSIVMNLHYHDGFFRNAYVRELSHSIPPQMSFASGYPVSHHYSQDLFVAAFYRHLHIGVLDLQHRLVNTFFFFLLLLNSFILIRTLTGSEPAALMGTFLIIFGSGGFAYAVTWFLGIPQWGNVFYTFYFLDITAHNTILPAAAILFSGLFCAARYLESRKRAWLIFSSLLLALVLEYKMFMIGPVIGALFTAGLILLLFKRKGDLLKIWALTTAFALPLLATAYLSNKGGPQYKFTVKLVEWITFYLQNLEFHNLGRAWSGLINHAEISPVNIFMVVPIFLLFFAGGYGLSFFALPGMVKELFSFKKIHPARLLIMMLFSGCVLYFFIIYTSFSGRPRSYLNIYNYFISAMLLNIFWADRIFRFLKRKKAAVKIGVVVCIVALSIPNTIRFMRTKIIDPQPRPFPESFLQAADWMNHNSRTDAVIIHPEYLRYVCYFTDRRVVLDRSGHSYLTWSLTTRQIDRRSADIDSFFKDPEIGGGILKKYAVTHIWIMRDESELAALADRSGGMEIYTSLAGKTIRKYRKTHRLKPAYSNKDHVIFNVVELPENEQGIFVLKEVGSHRKFIPFEDYVGR